MIDPKLAQKGCRLLATVIGELMEDGANDALKTADVRAIRGKADRLKLAGGDITRLADAMTVLARHAAGHADQ